MKAWLNMWKNCFNYLGVASGKEYWPALIINIPAIFVFVIPYALLLRNLPISPGIASTLFIIVFHLPALSLYFRRANDAGWKKSTTLYLALTIPFLSGILVGLFPKNSAVSGYYSVMAKLFALSFGLFFYGGFGSIVLFGTPDGLPFLFGSGLLLMAGILIFAGIKVLK